MTRWPFSVIAAVVAAISAPASASGIVGLWSTGSEGGRVEIYRCGGAFCGTIGDARRLRGNPDLRDVRNSDPKLRQRRIKGLVVLNGFKGGPKSWEGGPVYDPESGDGAPRGQLKLLPDGRLELKGCVAFFCRTKTWSKIS